MKYAATTLIPASPAAVWDVLVDGASWPQWEPNVTRLDGTLEDGGAITVHTRLSDRASPVVVGGSRPHEGMTWTGGLPLGLFRGVRTFTLTPTAEGTRVEVEEVFTGPLLPLIRRTMPDLQPSFDAFVQALAQRVAAASG